MSDNDHKARRQLLVDALRSGEYKQTRGILRDGDGYCCLGVACDVFNRATDRGEWSEDLGSFKADDETRSGGLPTAVRAWYGFSSDSGAFYRQLDQGPYSLISMNDKFELSFDKIADKIAEEPAGLFTS